MIAPIADSPLKPVLGSQAALYGVTPTPRPKLSRTRIAVVWDDDPEGVELKVNTRIDAIEDLGGYLVLPIAFDCCAMSDQLGSVIYRLSAQITYRTTEVESV
jgi:hypothetical protein